MITMDENRAGFVCGSISRTLAAACLVAVGLGVSAPSASAQSDEEARAKELISTIQKEMSDIDKMLMEADSAAPGEVGAKLEATVENIEELLRQVQENQASVVRNIEELVKMTKYQQSNQSSGGGGKGEKKGSGSEPKNKERGKDKDPGELQKQGGPKDGQKPENQGKDQPKDGGPDDQEGEQKDGQAPPDGENEKFQRDGNAGRWGFLPPKVGETFTNLSEDEFPEKYRRLIQKYYQRENNKASKDG